MRRTFSGFPGRAMAAALLMPVAAFALFAGPSADAAPDDLAAPMPLTTVELDQLVAPVALYPDEVLDALLPATTAPSDVAAAAVFVGDADVAIAAAPAGTSWDVSVVALLQFPEVVRWMGENPAWVERTGYAVAMQQADLLAAVQRYRARAQTAGALVSNDRLVVVGSPQSVITIRAVTPDVVYVPVYDPWALDTWSVGSPFFTSWLSFSFGGYGLWGRHRIFWGSGIYAYGDAWWGGTWRSHAADWGTRRPVRWSAPYRADQPWARHGWNSSAGSTRVTAPNYRTRSSSTTRTVNVAPPPSSRSTRYAPRTGTWTPDATARTRRDPTVTVAPAAPVTRWTRDRTSSPRSRAPTAPQTPRTVAPLPTPRFTTPPPATVPRRTVDAWRTRGGNSLDARTRRIPSTPSTAPDATGRTAPTRVVPSVPRATPATRAVPGVSPAVPATRTRTPRARTFPPTRSMDSHLDGPRVREIERRGHASLTGV